MGALYDVCTMTQLSNEAFLGTLSVVKHARLCTWVEIHVYMHIYPTQHAPLYMYSNKDGH